MSTLSLLGFAVAALADVVLPVVIAVWLLVRNHRRRRASGLDVAWWVASLLFLALVGLLVWRAVESVALYHGDLIVTVTALALPLGAIPAVVNSSLMHLFFTDAEWAAYGYQPVLTMYAAGMFAWAVANLAAIRAIVSHAREVRWS